MFADLKARSLAARKAKDSQTLTFLSTLIGDLQANAKLVDGEKIVTEDDALAMVKKYLKGNKEILEHNPTNEGALFEKTLLEELLPRQMTEGEIETAINEIVADGAGNMGAIMAGMKKKYAGLYDGKTASMLAKDVLK